MTDDIRRFSKLKRVFVGRDEARARETQITNVTIEHRGVRVRLGSATDRTAAESFIGSIIFVHEKDAISPPKGAFFIHDLIGLNVVDEDGADIGVLKDVLKHSAHDVYVVERDGKEILLPAVKEFITKIDIEAKTMRVKLIDGMIE